MKLFKTIILALILLPIFGIATCVQGSDQPPQAWHLSESSFSQAFIQRFFVLEPGYFANFFKENIPLPSFLKIAREETAQQALLSVHPTTNVQTYEIKKADSDRLIRQSSWGGYFGDVSGRIGNENGKKRASDLVYSFGHTSAHFYFGYDKARNNEEWRIGVDNSTLMMFGASIDYKLAKAFYLIPTFTFYDWDKQLNIASKPYTNQEWIGGLQLRFVF